MEKFHHIGKIYCKNPKYAVTFYASTTYFMFKYLIRANHSLHVNRFAIFPVSYRKRLTFITTTKNLFKIHIVSDFFEFLFCTSRSTFYYFDVEISFVANRHGLLRDHKNLYQTTISRLKIIDLLIGHDVIETGKSME